LGAALSLSVLVSACKPGLQTSGKVESGLVAEVPVGASVELRRLTSDQYNQIILDVFGDGIDLGGRFDPGIRESGLVEVGASQASINGAALGEFDRMGRNIAAQVTGKDKRDLLMPCVPKSVNASDPACAMQAIKEFGPLLFRRPLSNRELAVQTEVANAAAETLGNFYSGMELSLGSMLASPQFLFRREALVEKHKTAAELDAYSKATRLSFFLWNTTPDQELLDAAGRGDLDNPKKLERQVERLLSSPKAEDGVRAFFKDFLEFERFDALSKDASLYPKYNSLVASDAQEQTLKTIIHHLINKKGDYRELFTTTETFLTPRLASVYGVPMLARPGMPNAWVHYDFEKGGQVGILSQISFVALHSHPGRSSPTLRGKALREVFLCQRVPEPPGNVAFTLVQDTSNPSYKTVRDRLAAHANEAMCAGCHKITDPLGFALEVFDTTGGRRKDENGAAINATGQLDGVSFENAEGLGKVMHDNAAIPACFVNRLYSYGVGRKLTSDESKWVKRDLEAAFVRDGYRLKPLLRHIALSAPFFTAKTVISEKPQVANSN
jgi:hypothetical protein